MRQRSRRPWNPCMAHITQAPWCSVWYARESNSSLIRTHAVGVAKIVEREPPANYQVGAEGALMPNNSLNPRLAAAGTVSRAGASTTIVAVPAYSTCLRSRG